MRALAQMIGSDSAVEISLREAKKIISPAATYPFLIANLARKQPLLIVTSSSRSAEDLANELRELHNNVMEFPAWETLPHERLSPRSDTVARRLATLAELQMPQKDLPIVVAPIRAVIHRFIGELAAQPLQTLEIGVEVDLTTLVQHLSKLAYIRTDLVEKRGEFAVRGGIVDLFLPLSHYPIRIDFFGDEIEEMSYFDVATQRTTTPVIGTLAVLPCRELLLTEDIRSRAEAAKSKYPAAIEILDRVAQGIITEGMESLIPILIDKTETILQRMPAGTEVIFIDDERIRMRTTDLLATNEEFFEAAWSHAALGAAAPLPVTDATYLSWDGLQQEMVATSLNSRALNRSIASRYRTRHNVITRENRCRLLNYLLCCRPRNDRAILRNLSWR
jgi:transcription-repair coupling factor (superfamily II helicase)